MLKSRLAWLRYKRPCAIGSADLTIEALSGNERGFRSDWNIGLVFVPATPMMHRWNRRFWVEAPVADDGVTWF